jgi:hypothetical protein
MPSGLNSREPGAGLADDFSDRLEGFLRDADSGRRRRLWYRRLRSVLPVVLLVGPLVGWRLMYASPDGVHASIDALAWVTFLLDVGIHVDTALLTYLDLSLLPTIVGGLLLLAVTATVLRNPRSGGR